MKLNKKVGAIIGSRSFLEPKGFERPKFADTLRFPSDITDLTAQNVSELIGKYTQLLCYVQEQHSRLLVDVMDCENRLEQLIARIMNDSPRMIHLERWRRDQIVESDARVVSLRVKLSEHKKLKELAWSFMQNYERCISALSRELTRKTASNDGFRHAKYLSKV